MANYPDRAAAEAALEWASRSNPGLWVDHSRYVAHAAEAIGSAAGLNGDKCYVLGLLHDIGRYPGKTYARHMLDGWRYCTEHGWTDAARICLTHSFPIPVLDVFVGWHDVSKDEIAIVDSAIHGYTDEYDRLIQLADALADGQGFCILEKRWIDVLMRYGWTDSNIEKWKATLAIKRRFDRLSGRNIYGLLPGLIENSLKDLPY